MIQRRSQLHLLGAVVGTVLSCQHISAQSVGAAAPIAAVVTTYVRCGSDAPGTFEIRDAGGIVVAQRGDSVFVVTADHVARSRESGCRVTGARIYTRDPFAAGDGAVLPWHDAKRDIAILVAVFPNGRSKVGDRRMLEGVRAVPERLFFFGCPNSSGPRGCWRDPREAEVVQYDSVTITAESPFLEEGYSGGAVVDATGQLVGMTLDYNGQIVRVLPWYQIRRWLDEGGYGANLPTRKIDILARRQVAVMSSTHRGPSRSDGTSVSRSIQVRAERWDSVGYGEFVGLQRLALPLTHTCGSCSDRRSVLGTVGYYVLAGVGFSPRNRTFRPFENWPVAPALYANALFGKSEQLVERLPAAVNPSTGARTPETFRTEWDASGGIRLEGALTIGPLRYVHGRLQFEYGWVAGMKSTFGYFTTSYSDVSFGLAIPLTQ